MCPIIGMAASVHNFWRDCTQGVVQTLQESLHGKFTPGGKPGFEKLFLLFSFLHVVRSQVVSSLGCTVWFYACSCFPCVHMAPRSSISRASVFSVINVMATTLYVPVFMIILCGGQYFRCWSWCIFLYSFSGQCVSCFELVYFAVFMWRPVLWLLKFVYFSVFMWWLVLWLLGVSVFSCIHVVANTLLVGVGVFFCIHMAVSSAANRDVVLTHWIFFALVGLLLATSPLALSWSPQHQRPALDPPGRRREWQLLVWSARLRGLFSERVGLPAAFLCIPSSVAWAVIS